MDQFIFLLSLQLSNNHERKFLPIFPGKHYNDQLNHILNVIGTPTAEDVQFIRNRHLRKYILAMPFKARLLWTEKYPKASSQVIDLLNILLKFNPNNRITATEALNHPYVEKYSDPDDEPVVKIPFILAMENTDDCTAEEIKLLIIEEAQQISHENCCT